MSETSYLSSKEDFRPLYLRETDLVRLKSPMYDQASLRMLAPLLYFLCQELHHPISLLSRLADGNILF